MLQKVEGIIIRSSDYGETNKVITLYTRELGKVGVMARGAKKPKSRLASVSQLFIYGTFLIQKHQGLGTLNQGEIIDSFKEVRNDLYLASYASYVVELLDRLTEEKEVNPYLFELVYQMLHYLDEGIDPEVLLRIYEMKMLAVAGAKPQLDHCASCQGTFIPVAFSIREAGFLCGQCVYKDDHALRISERTARLLRLFFYMDLNRLGKISLKDDTKKELKRIISTYYDEYVGLTLKSKRFIEQLEKMDVQLDITKEKEK
ncbi:DNA repair protein RecO [Alkalihalobacillus alcalophilus ATCC 27647 = CGMCC 1.3604]|uniref:DNA repair protein RecO n=1 Tax=Alkalihalobacillus alcalophilus ATCC 27647 = CGMCC 1.3604 TaxID=1218173 RepID=A0A094WNK8_ALKAL|nr:DNA repair protein RecO [Alkalihalobacillus alcalophilus]KGA98431.1 DNA recombination protein RecO [Alkalihalobacillus alcalophilus ATCC 27647 = CGMCC 1.3604]MED1563312.1 DNA repair protein RecO [Alkalihalobacillus alcalophilus]THG88501.1 DNA repair protein RecO [Alkalihalobacillus alcalophilus ATCC 27647 = CGMCC 1.3604]